MVKGIMQQRPFYIRNNVMLCHWIQTYEFREQTILRLLRPLLILFCVVVSTTCLGENTEEVQDKPILLKKIAVPDHLLSDSQYGTFGGDIRIGDLTGDGEMDFLVYRTVDGVKPCFIGAFNLKGEVLWQKGKGGEQPARPGPVAVYDIDGDGETEVICFFHDPTVSSPSDSLKDVNVQILDGKTGKVKKSVHPKEFDSLQGSGANWVHQRILIANLRGQPTQRDFIVKLGNTTLAFDSNLNVLWTYTNPWVEYSRCPAYIPCVGDIDGDGKDEVNGGYFMLDDNGTIFWEKQLGRNMDSVAIAEWDNGKLRAFCSGFGHVMDHKGNVVLKLGKKVVPHGQELRVGRFDDSVPGPQMMIRYNGHTPEVMLISQRGKVIRRFRINESPNNTGMETIYWHDPDAPALLYNGGILWRGNGEKFSDLPGLPKAKGDKKQGWYHCIPTDIHGSPTEELLIYNPWDPYLFLYTKTSQKGSVFKKFTAGPRQYNVRLMD